MRTSVFGVMSVDITEILLAITVGVGHREFEMRGLDMDDVIQLGVLDLFMKQVMKSPFRFEFLSIQHQGQPAVEIGIVPEALSDHAEIKTEFGENRRIRKELDSCPIPFAGRFLNRISGKDPVQETGTYRFAFTMGNYLKCF